MAHISFLLNSAFLDINMIGRQTWKQILKVNGTSALREIPGKDRGCGQFAGVLRKRFQKVGHKINFKCTIRFLKENWDGRQARKREKYA